MAVCRRDGSVRIESVVVNPSTVQIERVIELATEARSVAYSPYSNFPMGAALIGIDGEEIKGTLVENVSLGLAICSERVALFSAVTERVAPVILAVCSQRTDDALTFPCGACLQVALEVAGPDLTVVAVDLDGDFEQTRVSDLLPRAPHRHTAAHQFTEG
jgi:cytidine deaminase